MEILIFFKGLLIGLFVAAPIGPVGLFCISRVISGGRVSGMVCALGVGLADALYAGVAGFGISSLSGLLLDNLGLVRFFGGAFLVYLGYKIFRAPSVEFAVRVVAAGLVRTFIQVFVLALTNPVAILSFAALFSVFGILDDIENAVKGFSLVAGVFGGSVLWWVFLTLVVGGVRERFKGEYLALVNRLSGVAIVGFGAAAFLSLFL